MSGSNGTILRVADPDSPELTWAALHIFVDPFLSQVYICLASNSHLVQGSRKRSFFTTESGSTVEFEIGFSSEYSMILFWSQLKSTWLPARLNTHDQSADHFSRMAILHSQLYSPIRIHQNKYAALPHITSNPTCSAIFPILIRQNKYAVLPHITKHPIFLSELAISHPKKWNTCSFRYHPFDKNTRPPFLPAVVE